MNFDLRELKTDAPKKPNGTVHEWPSWDENWVNINKKLKLNQLDKDLYIQKIV